VLLVGSGKPGPRGQTSSFEVAQGAWKLCLQSLENRNRREKKHLGQLNLTIKDFARRAIARRKRGGVVVIWGELSLEKKKSRRKGAEEKRAVDLISFVIRSRIPTDRERGGLGGGELRDYPTRIKDPAGAEPKNRKKKEKNKLDQEAKIRYSEPRRSQRDGKNVKTAEKDIRNVSPEMKKQCHGRRGGESTRKVTTIRKKSPLREV